MKPVIAEEEGGLVEEAVWLGPEGDGESDIRRNEMQDVFHHLSQRSKRRKDSTNLIQTTY